MLGEQVPPVERLAQHDPSRLRVDIVSTAAGFDTLRSEWLQLHEDARASVFQSFEWQRTWWKHLKESDPHARLHLVVLRAERRLVGVAPFFVEHKPLLGVLQLRRLAFVGEKASDYLDVLCAPGWEEASIHHVAAHLASLWQRLDLIELTDVSDRSPTHRQLAAALTAAGLPVRCQPGAQCPRTMLKETWEDTLAGLDGEHRRQLKKRVRQMRENFAIELTLTQREETVAVDMTELIAMHQHRMASLGKSGAFADQRLLAFHLEVAPLFLRRGWLFLAFLLVDGKRIAAAYSFNRGDELGFYLGGVADAGPAWKYSPGIVLHCLCAEAAIRSGTRVYDFLRGREPYKYDFGAVDSPNWNITVSGHRMYAALWRAKVRRRIAREKYHFAQKQHAGRSATAAFASYGLGRARAVASRALPLQHRAS